MRGLAREADLPRLRARVGLDPGEADAAAGAGRDVDDAPVARLLHARERPRACRRTCSSGWRPRSRATRRRRRPRAACRPGRTTPPALLTRMSTRPIRSTSAATCCGSATSAVSRSTPCSGRAVLRERVGIAAPMPCAVPVTSATRPPRSGTAPAVPHQVAHLLHARLPDAEDVLVRTLVERRRATRRRASRAPRRVGARASARCRPSASARRASSTPSSRVQGKFSSQEAWLASGSIDWTSAQTRGAFHQLCQSTCAPRVRRVPVLDAGRPGVVAAVPVDEQEAAEALAVQRVQQVAQDGAGTSPAAGSGCPGRRRSTASGRTGAPGSTGTPSGSAASTATRSDEDRVDREREVRVLLDRPERQDDAVVALEVRLDLHPVAVARSSRAQPLQRRGDARGGARPRRRRRRAADRRAGRPRRCRTAARRRAAPRGCRAR